MPLTGVFTVGLSGGLGNQMFQYALGRNLALRHRAELLLDTRQVDADANRSFALAAHDIAAPVATSSQLPAPLGRIQRRLIRWSRGKLATRYLVERTFEFDAAALERRPPAHLSGNWQSERYFRDCRETLRNEFQLVAPFSPARQRMAALIDDVNAVSVHVRRGDYVSNPVANAYHGTCEPAWYDRAKAAIENLVSNPRYFVFSDDPQWAKDNLTSFASAVFVAAADDGQDAQDLHLMARCRHHIIANSSFSWWGAWLNPRPDKVVVAPRNWFRGGAHDTRDLLPKGWNRL